MGYPQRIYTQLLKSRYTIDNSRVEKISMIHPKLISDNSLRGVFSLKRMNVFEVQEEEKVRFNFLFSSPDPAIFFSNRYRQSCSQFSCCTKPRRCFLCMEKEMIFMLYEKICHINGLSERYRTPSIETARI